MKKSLEQTIRLPYPHAGQQIVRQETKRFNWLSAGRRWRKTTMVMAIVVENAINKPGRYVWGAPTFDQVRIGYDETRRACGAYANFNQSRMTAAFPNGSVVYYRSLDDPDNARGLTADGVVIDECADVKESAWHEVLRPMLIDTDGWSWGIGTPKGYNWFWKQHVNAKDRTDTAAWEAPTLGVEVEHGELIRKPHPLENPFVPFNEIKALYSTLTERSFRQEILAGFVDLSGGVFRRVAESATAQPLDPYPGQFVMAADFGKLADFTVLTVIDVNTKTMVAMDRFNQIDYMLQLSRLKTMYDRYKPDVVMCERNSMGEPLLEQLYRDGLPVQPFTTTNATKAAIIDGLAVAFERQEIRILNNQVLINELQAYEMERLPSGMLRYNAPEGMHDDCVMSLALAWHCTNTQAGMEFA